MPQTIAQQFIRDYNRQEQQERYDERDDLRLVNSIIENNQTEDPNIAGNRQLTREKSLIDLQNSKRKQKQLEIDEAFVPFAKYMIDKKGAIRGDLSFKEIIKAKKELKPLIESIKNSKNKENDPYTSDYINNLGVKGNESLAVAEKNAKIKYSLIEVKKAIDYLGDNQLSSGKYNEYNSEYLIENAKRMGNASLTVGAEGMVNHFDDLTEMIQAKDTMFSKLDYFVTSKDENAVNTQHRIAASPEAQEHLSEAIRLTRNNGDENVGLIQKNLDKVTDVLSKMSTEDRKNAVTKGKSDVAIALAAKKYAIAQEQEAAKVALTAKNLEYKRKKEEDALKENAKRYDKSQMRLNEKAEIAEDAREWSREKYYKAQERLDKQDDDKADEEKLDNFNSYGNQLMENAKSIKDSFLDNVVKKNKNFEIFTIKKDALRNPKSRELALTNNRKNVHSLLRNSGIDFNSTIKWDGQNYASDIRIKEELSKGISNMETVMAYFSEGMNEKNKGNRQFKTGGGFKSLGEMRILAIEAGDDNETLALQSLLFSMVGFDTHIRSFGEDIVSPEDILNNIEESDANKALLEFNKNYNSGKK